MIKISLRTHAEWLREKNIQSKKTISWLLDYLNEGSYLEEKKMYIL